MELPSSLVIVEVRNAFYDWFTLVYRHTLKKYHTPLDRCVLGSYNRNTEETSWIIVVSCSVRDACCSFYELMLCLKTEQEAISHKEIVFRFRKNTDIQILRKAGMLIISCA